MKKKNSTFRLNGEHVLKQMRAIINEGNARKIIVFDKNEKELLSIPLTIGIVGTVFVPTLAAIGMLATLIAEGTVTVEREEQ